MPKLPQSLVSAQERGQLVPFVGAGLSKNVLAMDRSEVFPSWKGLLELAVDRLTREHRDFNTVKAFLEKKPPDFMTAAKYAREGLGALWPSFLRDALDPLYANIDTSSLRLAQAVWAIGSKLVITTNYDRVLRWACPEINDLDEWPIEVVAGLLDAQRGRLMRPTIWHLHGSVVDPSNIILAPDGYRLLYANDEHERRYGAALKSLHALLTTRHFLFLGFSFQDEWFVDAMRQVSSSYGGLAGPHFVLVRKSEEGQIVNKLKGIDGLDIQEVTFSDFGEPQIECLYQIANSSANVNGNSILKSAQAITKPPSRVLTQGSLSPREQYLPIIDEWANRAKLDTWMEWTSYGFSQPPRLSSDDVDRLGDLGLWLLNRVWPGAIISLENGFTEFRRIVNDLLYSIHDFADPNVEKVFIVDKIYKGQGWLEQDEYERLLAIYNYRVNLIQDLMLELTRSANRICDIVRREVREDFRRAEGHLSVRVGPTMSLDTYTCIPRYIPSEHYESMPTFRYTRTSREHCLTDPRHTTPLNTSESELEFAKQFAEALTERASHDETVGKWPSVEFEVALNKSREMKTVKVTHAVGATSLSEFIKSTPVPELDSLDGVKWINYIFYHHNGKFY